MERYRITPDAALYYCTFSIVEWLPVFVSEHACELACESLRFCCRERGLCVDSYVIMPTHLHLIVFDHEFDSVRLDDTLTQFRKFTGRQLVEFCQRSVPACYVREFEAAAGDDRLRRFWQPTRHPESITSEKFHQQKRDYLHDNPRRKGLVLAPSFWRWSSARWYETQEAGDVPVTPIMW